MNKKSIENMKKAIYLNCDTKTQDNIQHFINTLVKEALKVEILIEENEKFFDALVNKSEMAKEDYEIGKAIKLAVDKEKAFIWLRTDLYETMLEKDIAYLLEWYRRQ